MLNPVVGPYLVALEDYDKHELTALHLAVVLYGSVASNVSGFQRAVNDYLIDQDGRPREKESLEIALQATLEKKLKS